MAVEAQSESGTGQNIKGKIIYYGLFALVMGIVSLPLMGVRIKPIMPYMYLLVLHELLAFMFVGHTLFSNIWAMKIRLSPHREAALMARGFLRKMALGITLPTSILVPVFGLMMIEDRWGGLENAPWARDALIGFWLIWLLNIAPDIIRYAHDIQADNPRAGVMWAAARGIASTIITVAIIVVMATKSNIFPA